MSVARDEIPGDRKGTYKSPLHANHTSYGMLTLTRGGAGGGAGSTKPSPCPLPVKLKINEKHY